jgi:NLP/P60 family protein
MLKKGITAVAMLLSTSCGILQISPEKENKGKNNLEFENEGNEQVNDDIKVDVIINNKNSSKIVDKIQKNGRKQLRVQAFKENDIKARKIKDTSGEIEYEKLVETTMPNSQVVLQKLSRIKSSENELQRKLLKSYANWKGTKYQLGGDSKEGIDCSGLTRRIYREVYGIELPRRTYEQVKIGSRIERQNLKPGDIVYFKPEGTGSHTAVYLGETLFINASTAKGVVISTLENTYWNKYFEFGIRTRNA